jgi:hypothetical protein
MIAIRSTDVQPGGDRVSHDLLVNGAIVARYNTLSAALEARAFFLQLLSSGSAPAAADSSLNGSTRRVSWQNRRALSYYVKRR